MHTLFDDNHLLKINSVPWSYVAKEEVDMAQSPHRGVLSLTTR
jgi:hypothetical protein